MADNNSTHIRVKEDTADRLYDLKSRRTSYDDIVRQLLDAHAEDVEVADAADA